MKRLEVWRAILKILWLERSEGKTGKCLNKILIQLVVA